MPSSKLHQVYKTKSGVICPGCTTIAGSLDGFKNGGNKSDNFARAALRAAKEGDDYKEVWNNKRDAGTVLHQMAEIHIGGAPPEVTMDCLAGVLQDYSARQITMAEQGWDAFLDWEQKHVNKWLHSELQLTSEEYRFGGTLDAVAEITFKKNRLLALIDFKTGYTLNDSQCRQLAALDILLQECKGIKVDAFSSAEDTFGRIGLHISQAQCRGGAGAALGGLQGTAGDILA